MTEQLAKSESVSKSDADTLLAPLPYASSSKQAELNYLCRSMELARFFGAPFQAGYNVNSVTIDEPTDLVSEDLQIGTVIGNGCGLVVGYILHYLLRRHYRYGNLGVNPLYRNFKTLASLGWQAGLALVNLLGIADANKRKLFSVVLSDILSLAIGIVVLPYWYLKNKFFPNNKPPKFALTGQEGWSKYAKTGLVLGVAAGQVVGVILALFSHASLSALLASMGLWGGIIGVGGFFLAVCLVAIINWVSSKCCKQNSRILIAKSRNSYRNNYTRSGITLGAGLGACIGLLIGHWYLGYLVGAIISMAVGSVVGGIALSIFGSKLHKKFHPPVPEQKDDNEENPWDYASRNMATVFGLVGAAICCIINPASALMLAPIGTAIAGLIGWVFGLAAMRLAKNASSMSASKKQNINLPWTQRLVTGANIGSIIGSVIGVAIGFAGFFVAGPAGVILATSLFGALGAIIGSIGGLICDEEVRQLVKVTFKKIFGLSTSSKPDFYLNSTALSHSLLTTKAGGASSCKKQAKSLTLTTKSLPDSDISQEFSLLTPSSTRSNSSSFNEYTPTSPEGRYSP